MPFGRLACGVQGRARSLARSLLLPQPHTTAMAKRHVLILSDREGLLSQSSAVPADEAGRALDRVFISHPHPKTGASL